MPLRGLGAIAASMRLVEESRLSYSFRWMVSELFSIRWDEGRRLDLVPGFYYYFVQFYVKHLEGILVNLFFIGGVKNEYFSKKNQCHHQFFSYVYLGSPQLVIPLDFILGGLT